MIPTLTETQISAALRRFEHPVYTELPPDLVKKPHRAAAVLVPLVNWDNEWHLLFTRRTDRVETHKSQVSFPGGHYEKRDITMLNTALRECTEEIGVPADKIDIIGELDNCATSETNYNISAFVGLIPYPYDFRLDRREIERLIEVPVRLLLDAEYQQAEPGLLKGHPLPVYRYGNDVIWGATARILTQFLGIWTDINSKIKYQISKP